jgi:NADPH-dependent curcumin reductase CurA
MTQTADQNRQIILAQRPVGAPDGDTLRLETTTVPVASAGEMLLRIGYLSLDP